MNVGTAEDLKILKVRGNLSEEEKNGLKELLKEYVDIFAWSYNDMLGLDPLIVVHKLHTREEAKPKRQKLRCFKLDLLLKIKEEVKKLLEVGFIEVSDYPE